MRNINYWLFKSEPSTWSWQDQLDKGDKGEGWDGVRNYQASNNMKKMQKGDEGFFYHSVKEKRIVGIVQIIEEYQPDPTDATGRFGMVKIKALNTLKDPITLEMIKADNRFANLSLVTQSRLSVLPVSLYHWKILLKMANN